MSRDQKTASPATWTIAEAKAHFAECIREAEAGRSIVLTRHGRAVARLVPIGEEEAEPVDTSARVDHAIRQPDEIAEPASSYPHRAPVPPHAPSAQRAALRSLLEEHIWPRVPEDLLGRGVTKRQREEILGYAESTGTSATKRPARDRR